MPEVTQRTIGPMTATIGYPKLPAIESLSIPAQGHDC